MVDVEKALVDPALVFKTPEEVLADSELSREQKIKILRRWEYDVRELQVAEEEGMEGPQPVNARCRTVRPARTWRSRGYRAIRADKARGQLTLILSR